jgi:hypothetical protein
MNEYSHHASFVDCRSEPLMLDSQQAVELGSRPADTRPQPTIKRQHVFGIDVLVQRNEIEMSLSVEI